MLNNSSNSNIIPEEHLQYILERLSLHELEDAARTSFAYSQNPCPSTRKIYATEMARRFLESKQDPEKALQCLRETLQYRKSMNLDALRGNDVLSKDHPLAQFLTTTQQLKVGCLDSEGRSTYHFVPSAYDSDQDEVFLKAHLYTIERAIACSQSADRTINAIIDLTHFSMRYSPPQALIQELLTILRKHYVGHIHQIVILQAPAPFTYLWKLLKSYVGKQTRDRIHFVSKQQGSGKNDDNTIIHKLYKPEQAAQWMSKDQSSPGGLDFYFEEYLALPFDKTVPAN
jgi:hypothetical protein